MCWWFVLRPFNCRWGFWKSIGAEGLLAHWHRAGAGFSCRCRIVCAAGRFLPFASKGLAAFNVQSVDGFLLRFQE